VTPSWYDVLDVDPTASSEQIRETWKAAIADLDPTDRRFRLLNQAAEVLLDPTRRAEHDAALAADANEDVDAPAAEPPVVLGKPVAAAPAEPAEPAQPVVAPTVGTDDVEPAREPAPAVVVAGGSGAADETAPARAWWQPPALLLLAVALVAAALVAVGAWQLTKPSDTAVEASTRAAQTAAERASESVLAYDYRDMTASKTAASAYLTPSYRKSYDQLFTVLEQNAATVKPVVTVQVVASAVQRVNPAGDRVSVLVFLNRPTTNAEVTTPRVSQDQVLMKMEKVDGDWLVDDMVTTPASQ